MIYTFFSCIFPRKLFLIAILPVIWHDSCFAGCKKTPIFPWYVDPYYCWSHIIFLKKKNPFIIRSLYLTFLKDLITLNPFPDKVKELSLIFIFTPLCGASKGFMKALKAFIKPFEAPQRSVKINLTQFLFPYSFQKWTGL